MCLKCLLNHQQCFAEPVNLVSYRLLRECSGFLRELFLLTVYTELCEIIVMASVN